MKEIRPYLIVISAILSFLSFPPFPFGPLIFVTLALFLYSVEDLPPWEAFKYGYLWGMVFHLGLLYYIGWVTVPGMIATVLILSLIPAVTCLVFVKLYSRNSALALVFVPAFFLAWNWLLTKSDLNYPWTDFGYALSYFLPLIQAAELGGVYLISLLIIVVNLFVYRSISPRMGLSSASRRGSQYIAVLIVIALYFYGQVRLSHQKEESGTRDLTVALIQGNVTKDIKWNPNALQYSFDRYFELSRKAAAVGAELIIWPETAIPTYLAQEPANMAKVKAFVDTLNLPVLTGVVYYETVGPEEYDVFNSAIFLTPHNPGFGLYSKIHLVPMSEKIPFSERYRKLREIRLGQADFSSGRDMTIFHSEKADFSTLICFESTFPRFASEFCRRGAEMLVVITNDMWFGKTSLFEQHAMMAVFRAIENRVPVVRAANTGISMAIDKWGNIQAKSGIFKEEYLVVDVYPEESSSLYNRIGDVIPQAAFVITLVSLAVAFWRRRKHIEVRYAR